MTKTLKLILITSLALLLCMSMFTACDDNTDDNTPKLTEQTIKAELEKWEFDGTLSIDKGNADNVKAFSYITESSSSGDKSYFKYVIKKAQNGKGLTLSETQTYSLFCETMCIVGIFYEKENFDGDAYIEELLTIICDGASKTYDSWTISATTNQTSGNMTIKATKN